MKADKRINPLFERALWLKRAISNYGRTSNIQKVVEHQSELKQVLNYIDQYFANYYDPVKFSEPMPADENMGELTHADKRSLDHLINHIRNMGDVGASGNELVQLSRTMRRHVEVGYRLPAYMAERGIRLRKSPKGWNYIHEDWDF